MPTCQRPRSSVPGVGFEPTRTGSKPASLPVSRPRKIEFGIRSSELFPECPAGVGPACPVWKTGAFAARPRTQSSRSPTRQRGSSGRRGSRTLKASRFGRFRDGCHRQLACPSVSSWGRIPILPLPATGLESYLTVWMAGFEPANSGSRSRWNEPLSHIQIRTFVLS